MQHQDRILWRTRARGLTVSASGAFATFDRLSANRANSQSVSFFRTCHQQEKLALHCCTSNPLNPISDSAAKTSQSGEILPGCLVCRRLGLRKKIAPTTLVCTPKLWRWKLPSCSRPKLLFETPPSRMSARGEVQ